jgi:hypothetical protein
LTQEELKALLYATERVLVADRQSSFAAPPRDGVSFQILSSPF